MKVKSMLKILAVVLIVNGSCCGYGTRLRLPIGVISEDDDPIPVTIARYALSTVEKMDWPREYFFEIVKESVSRNDETSLDRAVCSFLKQGVYAIISKTNIRSYQLLTLYSNEYQVPLLSPAFPEVSPDLTSRYGVDLRPSTVRAILDLLRFYKWKDIVYLFDSDNGSEKLQKIYQLGYRVLECNLLGILKVSHAEQANHYLRKLESIKRRRSFHIILDLDPVLAKNIIIRHVHDVHVGKSNFHFLIADPVLEEFWESQSAEFGAVNVTGFTTLSTITTSDFIHTWAQLPTEKWNGAGTDNLNISAYYFYDAAIALSEGLKKTLKTGVLAITRPDPETIQKQRSRDCLQSRPIPMPQGSVLAHHIRESTARNTLSGKVQFDARGRRKDFSIDVIESSRLGHKKIGFWSDTQGLRQLSRSNTGLPTALPRTDSRKRLKIMSILNSPFLMRRPDANASALTGNDRFEGYCKDIMDLLAKEMDFEYELILSEDGTYGKYNENKGEWTGMVGALIRGKADMVVADLQIRGKRRKVVDYANDPIGTTGVSLLMKNPHSVSKASPTYILSAAFAKEVWICIFVSAILTIVCFYILSKFTGSPDNIEATSGIWGKKFTPVSSTWFIIGSSLMHGTGIYPRSISCRIIGGTWWCFTLIILALYFASTTTQMYMSNIDAERSPQLARLSSLSLESVLKESMANNWPRLGIRRGGTLHEFIQTSSLPLFESLASHLRNHPDYLQDKVDDGVQKVRQSGGGYAFLMESSGSEYYSREGNCDTVSIHNNLPHAEYGIAVQLGSPLKPDLNVVLRALKNRGEFGHLYQKWWIKHLSCDFENEQNYDYGSLKRMAGLFYIGLVGLIIVALVSAIQYLWKAHKREERRQRLSFEEVAMNQSLPSPPPELLVDSSMEDDSGGIDGWAERKLVPTSFGHESGRSTQHDDSLVH